MSEVGGKRPWRLGGETDEDGLATGELSCEEGLKGGGAGQVWKESSDGRRCWRWRGRCLGAGLLARQPGRAVVHGAAMGVGGRVAGGPERKWGLVPRQKGIGGQWGRLVDEAAHGGDEWPTQDGGDGDGVAKGDAHGGGAAIGVGVG
eukprot:scaffold1525_cov96-Amphora_coffeaeformis.AAC.3